MLKRTLVQPAVEAQLRRSLVDSFQLDGPGWPVLDGLSLPQQLPKSRDTVLLALRRVVKGDPGELRAMHRVALERAAERPYGFLYLVLEETAQMDHVCKPPGLGEDAAFRSFFTWLPAAAAEHSPAELMDLHARAILEAARRQIATGDPLREIFLPLARVLVGKGTLDLELDAFLNETAALALAADGRWIEAVRLWIPQVEKLVEYPVVDRVAESLADLADLVSGREEAGIPAGDIFYTAAENRLAELPPTLNQKLRRRLESFRRGF